MADTRRWYHPPGRPRLKPPWGMSETQQRNAEKAAANHPLDNHYLPDLGATETIPEMHLLWQHCMRSQITPDALRRMKREHLLYLAAHSGEVTYLMPELDDNGLPIPGTQQLVQGRNPKLQENALRAKYELERRDRRNAAVYTTLIAATMGALVGGLLTNWPW